MREKAADDREFRHKQACKILDPEDYIPSSSLMFRRMIFDQGVALDEELRDAEDFDFNLQVIGRGYSVKRMPMLTYRYRIHAGQKSRSMEGTLKARDYILKKLRRGDYFCVAGAEGQDQLTQGHKRRNSRS